MMTIDANVYWLPETFFTDATIRDRFQALVNAQPDTRATFEQVNGAGKWMIEKPIGQGSLDYFENDYRLETQLSDMDTANVDVAILKAPGCQEWFDLSMCQWYNQQVAEHISKSHGRMCGLATVPPDGTPESLAELDHCIHDYGFVGVQVSAHYENRYLDDPKFRAFFKHVEALNIPVYVHHTPVPVEYEAIKQYPNFRRSYGRCADQIIAISRELFSNLFEDCPHLIMIHSMLGGGYFTYKDMFMPHDSGNGRFDTASSDQIATRLAHNIYYEVSHAQPWGLDNLNIAVKQLGADHVIYGSSYPVKQVWMTKGPSFMAKALNPGDLQQVMSRNAERLYGRKGDVNG